jgi:heme-binding uptake protein ChaN (Tiki superfamily)
MRGARLVLAGLVLSAAAARGDGALLDFLRASGRPPEEYVVSKFADHDVVFLGERHWVKHDVEFVQGLIPRLHAAGVHVLAIEFACSADQAQADALVAGERYDEAAARRLIFRGLSTWGYREYEDLYRRAWELNRSLPAGAEKFRVLGLNTHADFSQLRDPMTPEQWKKVWFEGSSDEHMARVIHDELIAKKTKALVYCGRNHAFTRYRQPELDSTNTKARGFMERCGNRVSREIGARAFTILFHAPLPAANDRRVRVASGAIDEAMKSLGDRRLGFDVAGTPAGALGEPRSSLGVGTENFTLGDLCDGWVFLAPLSRFEGVTLDPQFVTAANLAEARLGLSSLAERESMKTVEDFVREMRDAADVKKAMADVVP